MAIKIKNNENGKELTLRGVDNLVISTDQQTFELDFPEGTAAEKIIMRLTGQNMKITFSSQLYDSDTDLSTGGDNIKTKEEQRQYLVGVGGNTSTAIFSPGMTTDWTFTYGDETFTVIIERIDIRAMADDPMKDEAVFSLKVGSAS